ncbi:MAG: type III secretion system export apparatus subunit SctT [Chitinophagaceae bacterium]
MQNNLNLIDILFSFLLALALSLPRGLMSLRNLPIFFAQTSPMRVRMAVAIAMSLPITVLTYIQLQQRPLTMIEIVWILSKEVMVGLIIGFLISLPFWILQNIGVIIDVQRGNSNFPNSPGNDPDSLPTGELIKRFGVLIFLEMGIMANLYTSLVDSYLVWPILNPIPPLDSMRLELIIQRFNSMMISIVLYSSPVIIVLLLVEFGFGLLSIYAPQIQVTSATPAIKSLVALFILMLGIHTLTYVMGHEFNMIKDIMKVINYKPH